MSTKTTAQYAREDHRGNGGKFVKNPCECCGKGAPMTDYFSDVREIGGENFQFIVLDARCAKKLATLSDTDFAAFVTLHTAITSAW